MSSLTPVLPNQPNDALLQAKQCKTKEAPEARVVRQFLEALIYEKLLTDDQLHITGDSHKSDWRTVECALNGLTFHFRMRVAAFGRVVIEPNTPTNASENRAFSLEDLFTFTEALCIAPERRHTLRNELEQTVRLSLWNENNLQLHTLDRRKLGYDDLEPAIHEGHPYHPCFKARTGFTIDDHMAYGPESARPFRLIWLAIPLEQATPTLPITTSLFWVRELGAETYEFFSNTLKSKDLNPHHYCYVPVHPWQWKQLQAELNPETYVLIGSHGDSYKATQSLRTLINVSHPERAHIKLPMNLVNTSSLRTLEPLAVQTAPALSHWLRQVVDSDFFLKKTAPLLIMEEYASIHYKDTESPELEKQIACIWRQSVHSLTPNNKQALPYTALIQTESDGKPFIDHWVQTYDLESWLKRLLEVTILPVWHLLTHHGIALEAHAQNLVLIHNHGWPEALIIRDFHDSLEYVDSYLGPSRHLLPNFNKIHSTYKNAPANRYYWMDRTESLRELYMDTVYIYNLSELSRLLEQAYSYSESHFWTLVHQVHEAYKAMNITPLERIDAIGLQRNPLETESLLRKKFQGADTDEFHHSIPNPLSRTN